MKFIKSETGSVSIYFMIILTAIVFFNTVLIDFARIKSAERQSENAMRAALRSVLSNFDSTLQTYGLYAVSDQEEAKEVFTHVLQQNFLIEAEDDTFQLTRPTWTEQSIDLTLEYSLAHSAVFKQQVLEEMKYRAPIEFTLEVIDKFQKSGASEQMKEASDYAKLSKDLEELIDNRENSLDRAWSEAKSMIGLRGDIEKYHRKYQQKLQRLNDLANQIGIHEIDQIRESISSSHAQRDQLSQLLSRAASAAQMMSLVQSLQVISQKIADLENTLAKIIEYNGLVIEMSQSIQINYDNLMKKQKNIKKYLDQAKEYNEQLKKKLNLIKEQSAPEAGSILETTKSVIEHIHLLELSYFVQYELGISNTLGLFSGFHLQFDPLKLITGTDFVRRYNRLNSANDAYEQQASHHYSTQKRIEDFRQSKNAEIKQRKEDEIEKTKGILKKVKDLISNCEDDYSDEYEKLEVSNQKYNNFNQIKASGNERTVIDLDNVKDIGMKSMGLIDQLSVSLMNIRDHVYLNEYALTHFNYRTLNDSTGQSKSLKHNLYNQEVEYILYGLDSCVKNHGAAYAEMFGLRLAIRTMEALMDPDRSILAVGSPLLAFLSSVAEGAVKAYQDMVQLTAGKDIVLSSKLPSQISLNYKDYLRIFMFIHGREQQVITRVQGLIELNTGFDLQGKATYIQGSASSNIRLWFIPGVMHVLNQKVIGRKATITKSLDLSY